MSEEAWFFIDFSQGDSARWLAKYGPLLDDPSPCPISSLTEHKALVAYLDQQTSKIDELITGIQEGIKKLKERRMALISAAVTGKIDVRGEMAGVEMAEEGGGGLSKQVNDDDAFAKVFLDWLFKRYLVRAGEEPPSAPPR